MLHTLPEFPNFADLSLEMASGLRPFFQALSPTLSEFTFSNLYVFRRAHRYRVSRLAGFLLVVGKGYDGRAYAFPPLGTGDVTGASLKLCDLLAAEGGQPVLFPVPTAMVEAHYGGPRWRAVADRDQADYVYLREDLATLPGKNFHKRKNRLLKFLREEAEGYAYEPFDDVHTDACLRLASSWCDSRCSLDRPSTFLETEAVSDALRHRSELGLLGGVIRLADRIGAFCLGEPLNPETFVVHFEKAEEGREGLAQLMNRDFCLHGLAAYTYVNREQDLGDPGLRQAKQSYHPIMLGEKYVVSPA